MAATEEMKRSPVSKALEDRVRADSETVSHVLDPDRTSDRVRYPDPTVPHTEGQTGPDSMADVEMGRRTDAGPAQAMMSAGPGTSPLVWVGLGIAVVLILALVAFM